MVSLGAGIIQAVGKCRGAGTHPASLGRRITVRNLAARRPIMVSQCSWLPVVFALVLAAGPGMGQQQPASPSKPMVRQWTNTGGKALTAEYLGVQGVNVMLKMPDGKITPIPLFKLSDADNAYVKQNTFEYHVAWQAWPANAQVSIPTVEVRESPGDAGGFVYTTPHFRFRSNVNLGTSLMKDLAKVFELTYQLHSNSPFGILAKPEDALFEARLFGSQQEYRAAGGPVNTSGVYILKEKKFLAPLDMMGVKASSAGWRKASAAEYDPSTIVHELTHMLTHDMLDTLPLWLNEGYAEYIENIPLENGAFKVSKDKIKQGVLESFVAKYEKQSSHGRSVVVKLKGAERKDFLKSGKLLPLFHVAKVMTMPDPEWVTGQRSGVAGPSPRPGPRPGFSPIPIDMSGTSDSRRLPKLYQTAHLILYYYIQIEGEKGVTKIRRFLDANRRQFARYQEYLDDYQIFQGQLKEFMKLPGVTKLADGRIQFPSSLPAPKEPAPPFADPNMVKYGGLEALLDGETVSVVGTRIEEALKQDLGLDLSFLDQ
jgi:hypothetical protein